MLLLIFILGLILGSFYNVIILRTIAGESIVLPPSRCPNCKTPIKWKHKIPVLSFLFLKGKCSYCNAPIDLMYPVNELLTGLIFIFLYIKYGLSVNFITSAICMSLFVILTGMDIKSKKISTKYAVGLIIACILFNYACLSSSIIAAITGFLLVNAVLYLGQKLNINFIGEGDAYIVSALCAFTGFERILFAITAMIVFQALFSLPEFLIKIKKTRNYKLLGNIIWFLTAYVLLFAERIYIIQTGMVLKILIFLNIILSLFLLCKNLIKSIQNYQNPITIPLSPAAFLSALSFLLLF